MRRADMEAQKQIEDLIQDENDPRARTHLLVLYQLSTGLTDNIGAVRALIDEMKALRQDHDAHVKEEEKILQQGRGAWKIFAWVLITAQSVIGFLYIEHLQALKALQVSVVTLQKEIEVIQERHRVEDRAGRMP
jgi:hypothetical protein